MDNYFQEYCKAQKNIQETKLMIISKHISKYPLVEEMLGFQYHLHFKFAEFFAKSDKKDLLQYDAELSIYLLYYYNVQSLQSALSDLECNKIHQSACNIRTVYESIPKMYYISFNPTEVPFIRVQEHIVDMHYEKAKEEIKKEECLSYLQGNFLDWPNEDSFDDFKKKYSPESIVKKLYAKKQQKAIRELYGKFSNSVHANITRNRTATDYEPKNTDLFFELITILSYFNIQAYSEGCFKLLYKLGWGKEIQDFYNAKAKEIESFIQEVYFFPNKKGFEEKMWAKKKIN